MSDESSDISTESDLSEISSDSSSFGSSPSSNFASDSSSESVQDYSFRVNMDESHDQSGSEDLSNDESRESSTQSTGRIAQMLDDISSITRYCENLASQFGSIVNSTPTSTPTVNQGRRRRLDVTPVEVIDLSSFEFVPPARPRTNGAPEAVIDLCTPDRSNSTNRRTSQQSTSNAAVVDLEDPSPPKRSCPALEKSQGDESYKCPVCLEKVRGREPVSTKCGHVFCKECLVAAINSVHKCPLCNKKLTQRQFSRIYL